MNRCQTGIKLSINYVESSDKKKEKLTTKTEAESYSLGQENLL